MKSLRASTPNLRLAQVLPLHLALPGCDATPVGILLLDSESDRVYCKIASAAGDEDSAEVLGYLADDLLAKASEFGGASLLEYLENTLSNSLSIGGREQIYVGEPSEALDQFFNERVTKKHVSSPTLDASVFVVEDNPADLALIKMALRQNRPNSDITVAIDGDVAVNLLASVGRDFRRPDLVLLDLNLPKRSGHEVLDALRANPKLKTTPVAILSSSRAPNDIKQAYEHGADCYVCKPNDLEQFNQAISTLCSTFLAAAA